jgi:hypothetical protein
MLEIEPGARVVAGVCDHCGEPMSRVTGFVHRNGDAYAVYYASCYHHDGHEVWMDAVFSPSWAEDADDHFTFGCRVGKVAGQDEPAASLVAAAAAFGESRVFGHKLSRDEALAHPMLAEFLALVDHVLTHDEVVSTHIYGRGATR